MAAVLDDTPSHLRGNGRPVTEEQTLTDLSVKGTIPAALDGRYLRNGANPFTGTSPHPFFGDGMIHGVRLRDGRYVLVSNPRPGKRDPMTLAVSRDWQDSRHRFVTRDLSTEGGDTTFTNVSTQPLMAY